MSLVAINFLAKMEKIKILPIGGVASEALAQLANALPFGSQIISKLEIPTNSYNPRRDQYLAAPFLKLAHELEGVVLGVTDVDLYAGGLNFIFGQAELRGRAAVISIYRLKSRDRNIFISRMVKEAVHELGHVFGLEHCTNERCVMRFSNCLEDTDRKGEWYCAICEEELRNRRLAKFLR